MSFLSRLLGLDPPPRALPDICPLSQHGSAHDEELIDKTVFESHVEQLWKNGRVYKTHTSAEDVRKKVVYIFKCKYCGRVRKDTETSQE